MGSISAVWNNLNVMAGVKPVENNREGSYMTMWSLNGLVFGIINVIGNFGTVFVDQSYWQGAIGGGAGLRWRVCGVFGDVVAGVGLDWAVRSDPRVPCRWEGVWLAGKWLAHSRVLCCMCCASCCHLCKTPPPLKVRHGLSDTSCCCVLLPSYPLLPHHPPHSTALPSATYKGYLLGGLCWFAVPFTFATSMGLAARAMNLPVTLGESGAGLVPPAVVVELMGAGGGFLLILQLWMAVTATANSEQLAVASLFAYDVYRTYFNPKATGKQLVFVSRIMVCVYAVLSGVLAIVLMFIGLNLGWVYLVRGRWWGWRVEGME